MRKKREKESEKESEKVNTETKDLRHFEALFKEDKREAEDRLALVRARIRTLERAIAFREKTWSKDN